MVDDSASPSAFPFPSDDEATDARWLAGLIRALRAEFTHVGQANVAAILDEAFVAAEAAADISGNGRIAGPGAGVSPAPMSPEAE